MARRWQLSKDPAEANDISASHSLVIKQIDELRAKVLASINSTVRAAAALSQSFADSLKGTAAQYHNVVDYGMDQEQAPCCNKANVGCRCEGEEDEK